MKLQTRKILPGTGPASLDANGLTVMAVAATEAPVSVFTWERGIINESLLLSGVELPLSGYVPLLDSHVRSSVKAILGRADSFQVIGDQLHCRVVFDPTEEGRAAFERVKAGSLDAFSIGYRVLDSTWIDEGDSRTVNGRLLNGPLQLATKTELKELSAVAIPADPAARARSDETIQTRGSKDMIEENTEQRAAKAERGRITEITAMCQRFECAELQEHFIEAGISVDEARKAIMDKFLERKNAQEMPGFSPPLDFDGPRFHAGRDASEKRRDAVVDGLVMRSGVKIEQPAPGWNEYAHTSFLDLAEECLRAAGQSTRGMAPSRIFKLALEQRAHMSTDFSSLLADSAGKVLRTAYEQTPATWRAWCKVGSAKDFKNQSRPILSEVCDLDEVPENGEYKYGDLSDSTETFALKSYGKIFAITRQALINDDLGALTDIPKAWGAAASRKINSLAYGILTTNAAMADGVALFHATHANLGTNGAPSITTLSEARKLMRLQKGPQKLAILNVAPRTILCPAALETVVDQLLVSVSLDSANPAIVNPFAGQLVKVCDPILDASSTSAWYLLADPSSIDTVEISFLNGVEAPYLEQRDGWSVDGLEYKCRIDVGAKALDWRGMVKNPG